MTRHMTRQQLIQRRNEVCNQLIAEGWDYDDARFATMALGSGGVLDEQPQAKSHPLIEELRREFAKLPPAVLPSTNSSRELPDFDRDTSVTGVE